MSWRKRILSSTHCQTFIEACYFIIDYTAQSLHWQYCRLIAAIKKIINYFIWIAYGIHIMQIPAEENMKIR